PGRRGSRRTRAPSTEGAAAPLSARSSREAFSQRGEQPYAVSRPAGHAQVVAARAVEEAGAGHVDVRPRPVARELAQELGRERGASLPQPRAVLHVGIGGVDVAAIAWV